MVDYFLKQANEIKQDYLKDSGNSKNYKLESSLSKYQPLQTHTQLNSMYEKYRPKRFYRIKR